MAHDVFISHSSKDKAVADQVCAALEASGLRCWIAPRDIKPGQNWATSILRGIAECRIMVLVFSSHSNCSQHVRREVERAAHREIPIAPLRISDEMPKDDLEYFLSSSHWMDALTPPFREHLLEFAQKVRALLEPALGFEELVPNEEPHDMRTREPMKTQGSHVGRRVAKPLDYLTPPRERVQGLFGLTPTRLAAVAFAVSCFIVALLIESPLVPNWSRHRIESYPGLMVIFAIPIVGSTISCSWTKSGQWRIFRATVVSTVLTAAVFGIPVSMFMHAVEYDPKGLDFPEVFVGLAIAYIIYGVLAGCVCGVVRVARVRNLVKTKTKGTQGTQAIDALV